MKKYLLGMLALGLGSAAYAETTQEQEEAAAKQCVRDTAIALSSGNTESAETLARVGLSKCSPLIDAVVSSHAEAYSLVLQFAPRNLRSMKSPKAYKEDLERDAVADAVVAVLTSRAK